MCRASPYSKQASKGSKVNLVETDELGKSTGAPVHVMHAHCGFHKEPTAGQQWHVMLDLATHAGSHTEWSVRWTLGPRVTSSVIKVTSDWSGWTRIQGWSQATCNWSSMVEQFSYLRDNARSQLASKTNFYHILFQMVHSEQSPLCLQRHARRWD